MHKSLVPATIYENGKDSLSALVLSCLCNLMGDQITE